MLYSTDASIYEVEPEGVAFPRTAAEAAALFQTAAEDGIPIIPRGAGTGLTGGALGNGLIVDFAKSNRQIFKLDLEQRVVHVGAGVVLDKLNDFLRPHNLCFGPDVATSSRATLGGMIANNSSGARAPLYGTTGDHVNTLEIILSDGRVVNIGKHDGNLKPQQAVLENILTNCSQEIAAAMPPIHPKRWPGYALDRCLREPDRALLHVLAGSEGTLAGIFSAELRLVPLPRRKGLGLLFFDSIADAFQATVELLDLKPAAIEHLDRILFDQTREQSAFQDARKLLELDSQPCESILAVEFFDDVDEKLADLGKRKLGQRKLLLTDAGQMNLVWKLRKAGLSLLTACPGPAKPVTVIEDAAVAPARLPEFVKAVDGLLKPLGLRACFYGHAASGLLHIRPVIDLHTVEGVQKLRKVADEFSALVRQFNGSLASEHGVGIARTQYMEAHLPPRLMDAMRQIKHAFDPKGMLNPGKIIDNGRFRTDTCLRQGPEKRIELPFESLLAFGKRDGSFLANLEQCNGCGECLKQSPVMCPTYIATGEEIMSTRGRANTIRFVLQGRSSSSHGIFSSHELDAALSNCLSCKACAAECPSNVNMALLKAELLNARFARHGIPLLARLVGSVDTLGKLGCLAPGLANAILANSVVRKALEKALGFDARRRFPRYAKERFDNWFDHRIPMVAAQRGSVYLWDDTFVRYHEPQIGKAAVAILEAAGFTVKRIKGRLCCGRPAFSQGNLEEAMRLGRHNLNLISSQTEQWPIIFLEPSCWSMFVEDYLEMKLPRAEAVSRRCVLFEQFIDNLLCKEPDALRFKTPPTLLRIFIHAHCHIRALSQLSFIKQMLQHLPGTEVKILETGCCGMAGAFGMMKSKYDLSLKIAQPLKDAISELPENSYVAVQGTSCRQQIEHVTSIIPKHPAEIMAEFLMP